MNDVMQNDANLWKYYTIGIQGNTFMKNEKQNRSDE